LARSEEANPEWWPEGDFDWRIEESPSGTSTLMIRMYPFYYNPQTTGARFYKNYSFDIHYITSTVEVDALVTDKDVYPQGDDVSVDLWLNNSGDAQDVIVDAVVKRASSGEVVDGLPLHSLDDLTGLASFSYQWGSTGFEPGYYFIEAEVRDSDGNVLDRAMEEFRLGIYAGEITAFTATPELFDIGDTIDISLVFSNTGTVPITGTAMIRVQSSDGLTTTAEFTHTIANLSPAHAVTVDDAWDTAGAEEGFYRIVGYVLYDAKATSPRTVVVSTEARIYLPIIMKNFQ